MTATRLPFLFCDYLDCKATFGPGNEDEGTKGTRDRATKDGWSFRYGSDLCPEHTAAVAAGKGRARVVATQPTSSNGVIGAG